MRYVLEYQEKHTFQNTPFILVQAYSNGVYIATASGSTIEEARSRIVEELEKYSSSYHMREEIEIGS